MNLLGVMPAKEGNVEVKSKKEFYVPCFCLFTFTRTALLMQECFLFYDKMLLAQKGLFLRKEKEND